MIKIKKHEKSSINLFFCWLLALKKKVILNLAYSYYKKRMVYNGSQKQKKEWLNFR